MLPHALELACLTYPSRISVVKTSPTMWTAGRWVGLFLVWRYLRLFIPPYFSNSTTARGCFIFPAALLCVISFFPWQESSNIAHVFIVFLSSGDGCVSLKLLGLMSIPEVIYEPFCSSCQSEELMITVSTCRRSHCAVNVLFSRRRGWNSKGNKRGAQLNWWMFCQLHPLPSWTQRTFAMTSPFTRLSSEIRLCVWRQPVPNIPQIRDRKKVVHSRTHNNIITKKRLAFKTW